MSSVLVPCSMIKLTKKITNRFLRANLSTSGRGRSLNAKKSFFLQAFGLDTDMFILGGHKDRLFNPYSSHCTFTVIFITPALLIHCFT